jgi:ribosomal protein S12 methylthiotransferase
MELQRSITAERYERHLGRRVTALVDRGAGEGPAEARVPWQADDIDGVAFLDVDAAPGSFVEVELRELVDDYHYEAAVRGVVAAAPGAPARSRRLPLAAAGASSIGSFGR